MRVLILGATGFTGTEVCSLLSRTPGVHVTAVINRKQPVKKFPVDYIHTSLQSIDADFLAKGNYDYIFHLARIPGKRFGNIGRLYAGITGGTANRKLLKHISKLAIQPKLIYLSGSLMYGHNPGHESIENDKLNPAGFAKYYYLAERPLLQAMENGDNQVMMLRAPWIIGNGSWFSQLYVSHIKKQQLVPVYGNEERKMSFIPVEDCAGMLWHYATNAAYNKVYNIYTFKSIVYRDFVNSLSAAYQCRNVKKYTEEEIVKNTDRTTQESICCEVVLSTQHTDILNSYKKLYSSLEDYIKHLAKT